jgi:hypothetical protein
MTYSRSRRRAVGLSMALAVGLMSAGTANAQPVPGKPISIRVGDLGAFQTPRANVQATPQPQPIRRSLETLDYASLVSNDTQPRPPRRRSVGRRIVGGALGGVGGFFAGGILGAKIDGDCGGCDDPGLIGAPIGAAVGAILGAKFF